MSHVPYRSSGNTGVTGVTGETSILAGLLGRFSPTPAPTTPPTPAVAPVPAPPPSAADPAAVRVPPGFPPGAVLVIADADGYTDHAMKGPPYMWCWINGPEWYYVKDFPVPIFPRS